MIIRIDDQSRLVLEDASNFRAFKLLASSRHALAPFKLSHHAVEVTDEGVAWVQQGWILAETQLSTSPEWKSGFDGMVAFAASKGWLRDSDNAIRAHIEFAE